MSGVGGLVIILTFVVGFGVLFTAIVVVAVVAATRAVERAKVKRQQELVLWAKTRRFQFRDERDPFMGKRFPNFTCLQVGSKRYAYNIMAGHWSGRPIFAFDYHRRFSEDDQRRRGGAHPSCWSVVIIGTDFPLKPLLIRPETGEDKIKEFLGWDDIDFESAEFSSKFYVKAKDKRWAYDVLHSRTIEFLLDRPQLSVPDMKAIRLSLRKYEGRHVLAIASALDRPQLTIQFDGHYIIANGLRPFETVDFENAADTICGILDQMPEYLVKQLREQRI